MKEERKKFPMLLAVIIVVIIIVAAIGAAFGLGLFGKKKAENQPPVVVAAATSPTAIAIGDKVNFSAVGSKDPDKSGSIVNYTWYYGDGATESGASKINVTHQYNFGGLYLVWLVVTDNDGATGSNEISMISVGVAPYDPLAQEMFDNTTAPKAILGADNNVISPNTTVVFNMTGTIGVASWSWVNASNHSEGQDIVTGYQNLTSLKLDYGDGSAVVDITPAKLMTSTHKYTTSGHFVASLTAGSTVVNPYKSNAVTTTSKLTIHVLKVAASTTVKNPNTFIEATIGDPQTLDPAIDYETAGGNVLQNCYDTLLWYDGGTTTLIPWLATAVPSDTNGGISPNGLFYNFTIRQNVKFHDNTTLTVEDVVFSIQRVLKMHDPTGAGWMVQQVLDDYLGTFEGKTVSKYLGQAFNATWIYNYLIAQSGGLTHVITAADTAAVAAMVVSSPAANVVQFKLTHPYPGFLAITAYTVMDIVSKAHVLAHPNLNNSIMGTGPYKLVSWEVGAKIHMSAWSGYWGTKAKIPDVFIIKSEDVNTRLLMLQAGDADNIYLPIRNEASVNGNPLYKVYRTGATLSLTFFTFNFWIDSATANSQFGGTITDEFFQDIHMRRAFAAMFNYSLYIQNVARGNAITPNGPIPKGLLGYNASTPVKETNMTFAAEELKLTLNPSTSTSWFQSGFTIPLFYNAGNTARQTAALLIKNALEELSTLPGAGAMTATINALDWGSAYLPQMQTLHSYMPCYAIGWAPDYADPDDYANPIMLSTGYYALYTAYNNSTVDALVRAAAAESNLAIREKMYQDLQTMAQDDLPYIWFSQPNDFKVFRSWVTGYVFNPMYSDLYYAYLDK
jgi:peptide/nickel transport system substrate-binding protein